MDFQFAIPSIHEIRQNSLYVVFEILSRMPFQRHAAERDDASFPILTHDTNPFVRLYLSVQPSYIMHNVFLPAISSLTDLLKVLYISTRGALLSVERSGNVMDKFF